MIHESFTLLLLAGIIMLELNFEFPKDCTLVASIYNNVVPPSIVCCLSLQSNSKQAELIAVKFLSANQTFSKAILISLS